MEISEERRCRAIMIAVTDENAKIRKELSFFKEVAARGPARYADRVEPIGYDNNLNMTSEVIWRPRCINLELWFREVMDYTHYQASERMETFDDVYESCLRECINNMIYKTLKSRLPITSIREMIISEPMRPIIESNEFGLRSLMMDLTGLFTGVNKVHASTEDYLKNHGQ